MEICKHCPMRDERYETTSEADKREISNLKLTIASMTDFLEYLFDHSEHLDHITYTEAWEEFETWENKLNNVQDVQVSDTTKAE